MKRKGALVAPVLLALEDALEMDFGPPKRASLGGISRPIAPVRPMATLVEAGYRCRFCMTVWESSYILERHYQNYHERPMVDLSGAGMHFECSICRTTFEDNDDLLEHIGGAGERNVEACHLLKNARRMRVPEDDRPPGYPIEGRKRAPESLRVNDRQWNSDGELQGEISNNNANDFDYSALDRPEVVEIRIIPEEEFDFRPGDAMAPPAFAPIKKRHGGPVLNPLDALLRSVGSQELTGSQAVHDLKHSRKMYEDLLDACGNDPRILARVQAVLAEGKVMPPADVLKNDKRLAQSIVMEIPLCEEMPKLSFLLIHPKLGLEKFMQLPKEAIIQEPINEICSQTGKRILSVYASGDSFRNICDASPLNAYILALFLYSDETIIVRIGQRQMHPIYMILANAHADVATEDKIVLVGFVPILSVEDDLFLDLNPKSSSLFRARMFHQVLELVVTLAGMTTSSPNGIILTVDKAPFRVYPVLAAYLADRPEQLKASGKMQSHSCSLQSGCRMCSIAGSQFSDVSGKYWGTDIKPKEKYNEIRDAIEALVTRVRGTVGPNEAFFRSESRAEVISALLNCRHYVIEACSPHCSLHSFKIVMSTYLLNWVLQLLVREDEATKAAQKVVAMARKRATANGDVLLEEESADGDEEDEENAYFGKNSSDMIKKVNRRVGMADESIPHLYKLSIKGKGWKLNPEIKTGQYRARALAALTIAMRSLRAPEGQDDVYYAVCLWDRISRHVFARRLYYEDLLDLSNLIEEFRRTAKRAFANETKFEFPIQHDITHFPANIRMFGCAFEFTTDTMERLHGPFVKRLFETPKRLKDDSTTRHILVQYVLKYMAASTDFRFELAPILRIGLIGKPERTSFREVVEQRVLECRSRPDRAVFDWAKIYRLWDELTAARGNLPRSDVAIGRELHKVHSQMHLYPSKILASPRFHNTYRIHHVVCDGNGVFHFVLLIFSASGALSDETSTSKLFCMELDTLYLNCPSLWLPRVRASERYGILKPHNVNGNGIWKAIRSPGDMVSGQMSTDYILVPKKV